MNNDPHLLNPQRADGTAHEQGLGTPYENSPIQNLSSLLNLLLRDSSWFTPHLAPSFAVQPPDRPSKALPHSGCLTESMHSKQEYPSHPPNKYTLHHSSARMGALGFKPGPRRAALHLVAWKHAGLVTSSDEKTPCLDILGGVLGPTTLSFTEHRMNQSLGPGLSRAAREKNTISISDISLFELYHGHLVALTKGPNPKSMPERS